MLIEMTPALHFLFQQMIALTEHQNESTNNPQLMHAILTLLLNEISTHGNNKLENTIPTTISEKCMAYIADHIHLPISVDDIAKELNISVSHLAHSFKKQMNISIHQYILKKKLATAHHKIMDGKPATQAAEECGFNDYSGFYKQFKKTYHVAPSDCVFRIK
jgi:AraC-like DNA-binding protein